MILTNTEGVLEAALIGPSGPVGALFFSLSLSLRSIWQGYYLSCIYYYYFGNRWVDIVVPVWVN